jgi:hypothetical protein
MNKALEKLIDDIVIAIDKDLFDDYYNSKTSETSEEEVDAERDVLRDILEPILDDSEFLKILRQNGVDMWDGYEDAVELFGKPSYYE